MTSNQPEILASAPRCGARARTRDGAPCRSPAVRGSARCLMHGGKGSGAPRGNRNAWKHGAFTVRMKEIARYVRFTALMVRHARGMLWPMECEASRSLRRKAIARHREATARPDVAASNTPLPVPLAPPTPIDSGEQPHTPGNSGPFGTSSAALPVYISRRRIGDQGRWRRPGRRRTPRPNHASIPGARDRAGGGPGHRNAQSGIGAIAIQVRPKANAPPVMHNKMPQSPIRQWLSG